MAGTEADVGGDAGADAGVDAGVGVGVDVDADEFARTPPFLFFNLLYTLASS